MTRSSTQPPNTDGLSREDRREIESVIPELKSSFIALKNEEIPAGRRAYKLQDRHKAHDLWFTAAHHCWTLRTAPRDFVQRARDICERIPGGMTPSHLAGPNVFARISAEVQRERELENAQFTEDAVRSSQQGYIPREVDAEKVLLDLKESISYAVNFIYRCCGSTTIDYQFLKHLTNPMTPATALVRVLLGFKHEVILHKYYDEASIIVEKTPYLKNAMQSLNLPWELIQSKGEVCRKAGLIQAFEATTFDISYGKYD